MTGLNRQRGIALMMAMLIVALLAILTVNLEWDNALDMRRTFVLIGRDRGMEVALGAESWVMSILRQDLEESQTDHLGELWATELPGLPFEGGQVFGAVEDLQGRFNLNNLIDANGQVDQASLEQFQRLLTVLGLDPRLAGITADWIDSDLDASFPDGAEDPIYTAKIPPYRTANQPLVSASEIAAIDGMDPDSYRILEPHITALPGRQGINVNTATPAVLQSLADNISEADVERLLQEREGSGFADVESSFQSLVPADVLNTLEESTQFFRLKVVVQVDTVQVTLYSVLQRGPRGDVTPILRSFGTT